MCEQTSKWVNKSVYVYTYMHTCTHTEIHTRTNTCRFVCAVLNCSQDNTFGVFTVRPHSVP